MPGNSPYHMGFPGTITLSAETLEKVYFEAAQSLIQHGFRRFIFLNAHGGNAATTRFIVDRINQETSATAVDLDQAIAPFEDEAHASAPVRAELHASKDVKGFDHHAGVDETSQSLYLIPTLVDMKAAPPPQRLTLPPDLKAGLSRCRRGHARREALSGAGHRFRRDLREHGVRLFKYLVRGFSAPRLKQLKVFL